MTEFTHTHSNTYISILYTEEVNEVIQNKNIIAKADTKKTKKNI